MIGLITAGGGITGYVRTGSIPSVAAGVTVGALCLSPKIESRYQNADFPPDLLSSYRLRNKQPFAIELGLLASVVLAGSSIPRAIKGGKPLPIGLSVLATIGLYNFGLAFANPKRAA